MYAWQASAPAAAAPFASFAAALSTISTGFQTWSIILSVQNEVVTAQPAPQLCGRWDGQLPQQTGPTPV